MTHGLTRLHAGPRHQLGRRQLSRGDPRIHVPPEDRAQHGQGLLELPEEDLPVPATGPRVQAREALPDPR